MSDIRIDQIAFTPDGVLVEYTPPAPREGLRMSTQVFIAADAFGAQVGALHEELARWLGGFLGTAVEAEPRVAAEVASRGIEYIEPWSA